MKRKIITTADGSKTIYIEDWNEHYHSIHGAIQEAKHVFIKHGLYHCHAEQCHLERRRKVVSASAKSISILEIGFGTGLNAFITCLEAKKLKVDIDYVGVEAYPISSEEVSALNYADLLSKESDSVFKKLHEVSWEEKHRLKSYFSLTKRKQFFKDIQDINQYNLIYFDAFAPKVQPELWTEHIFKIMFKALKSKGILVTYSAKGSVRRAMQNAGFSVERLEGPPGKREMLRACKEV
ncbi:MAG: tRNA (5-methylaminomethyl-2-thiouridine)(34)-methyltransferase MnmD [Bacteroidetes bacterium]|nr:tRNA (5-methylaminomethyl-2-thiouridine)(34)-methyltransferase MnmD [Bacteroidota bacterium]